jgi:pSer/pThr/pTyr-binding forkhead associated (FHA) protein
MVALSGRLRNYNPMNVFARLVSQTEGPDILVNKPILLFGRHPECDVLLNSKKISRKHCCLAILGNDFYVRDLGSTNGVKINGQRVEEGLVKFGDELILGIFPYKVVASPEGQLAKIASVTAEKTFIEDPNTIR